MPAIEAFRDASVPIILEPESVWLITSKLVILSKEGGKAAALSKLIKHSVFRGERKLISSEGAFEMGERARQWRCLAWCS